MPSATPKQIVVKNQDQLGYLWGSSEDRKSMTRQLANLERMFVIFNQELHGQNCPFFGATISVQPLDREDYGFDSWQLHKRAVEAFIQTRWKYPTVAARVVDGDKALYSLDSEEEVKKWADRTVNTVSQEGGWVALRERLSREEAIPTKDGDYCLFYLIVRPEEAAKPELTSFDVLMHTHHVFTDGSGIQSIFNEFLSRLANPLEQDEMVWGQEIDRLLPPSILLEKEAEPEPENKERKLQDNRVRLKGFTKPDIGLPVYRPDLGPPKPELRGTQLSSHTFDDSTFLRQLLNAGRKHGVKLAAVLHAALLKAIYDTAEVKPSAEDLYKSGSALNLRNGYMLPEFSGKHKYINSAVAIHPIEVPCNLFKNDGTDDDFWRAASFIGNEWETIKNKKNMGKGVESDAKAFLDGWAKNKNSPKPAATPATPPKPRTCPYFVSDAPGSVLLDATHSVSGYEDLVFVLESYQLATDQSQAVVSARSHSWNDKLTLCLVFNAARNPKEKMDKFLGVWVNVVKEICKK